LSKQNFPTSLRLSRAGKKPTRSNKSPFIHISTLWSLLWPFSKARL
jgi:hypothetical protein